MEHQINMKTRQTSTKYLFISFSAHCFALYGENICLLVMAYAWKLIIDTFKCVVLTWPNVKLWVRVLLQGTTKTHIPLRISNSETKLLMAFIKYLKHFTQWAREVKLYYHRVYKPGTDMACETYLLDSWVCKGNRDQRRGSLSTYSAADKLGVK